MAVQVFINRYKLFYKMNGKSLEDLDSRIENFKKYKLFVPDGLVHVRFNKECEENLKCQCSEYDPNEDYFLCTNCFPQVRYNNNFDVKYHTMVKQFRKIKDLDLKYSLLDVIDSLRNLLTPYTQSYLIKK